VSLLFSNTKIMLNYIVHILQSTFMVMAGYFKENKSNLFLLLTILCHKHSWLSLTRNILVIWLRKISGEMWTSDFSIEFIKPH